MCARDHIRPSYSGLGVGPLRLLISEAERDQHLEPEAIRSAAISRTWHSTSSQNSGLWRTALSSFEDIHDNAAIKPLHLYCSTDPLRVRNDSLLPETCNDLLSVIRNTLISEGSDANHHRAVLPSDFSIGLSQRAARND
jgi:hypothetical protein